MKLGTWHQLDIRMESKHTTYVQGFHDGSLEEYGKSVTEYSQLGKTEMYVSHMSLGGAQFGKKD